MDLEHVWGLLKDEEWASKAELEAASGLDENTLNLMINFLNRWNFIDARRGPELQVRRRPTAISPIETFQLLSTITTQPATPPTTRRIAERVACRSCGGRQLNPIGQNEVECITCREKQWYVLQGDYSSTATGQDERLHAKPTRLQLILIRLG